MYKKLFFFRDYNFSSEHVAFALGKRIQKYYALKISSFETGAVVWILWGDIAIKTLHKIIK